MLYGEHCLLGNEIYSGIARSADSRCPYLSFNNEWKAKLCLSIISERENMMSRCDIHLCDEAMHNV